MIGFFIFDEKPTNKQSLVLAHSKLNENIKGYFYVRTNDCSDICSVDKGSEFFGILDDSSGFGACLFIKDLVLETDALLLQNNLHVKNDTTIDGHLTVGGEITGKSTITKLTFTADDIATLASQITSMPGPCGVAKLNHVSIEMDNKNE